MKAIHKTIVSGNILFLCLLFISLMIAGSCSLDIPEPVIRPGAAYLGSAYWARDIAQPLITSFASDAEIYAIMGSYIYMDGRLPANTGNWSFTCWSPSRQEEIQIIVDYDGNTNTTTREQTAAPSSNGQPFPPGWMNSTVIFDATIPFRDPSASYSQLVVFNIITSPDPFVWGINFNRGTPPNHYVSWDGTYLCWGNDPVEEEVYTSSGDVIAVLVEPYIKDDIRVRLERLEGDLHSDGYGVYERLAGFSTPGQVRGYLADLYNRTGSRLTGAILIGSQPYAYQWITTTLSGTPTSQESISLQYYADLDGNFQASPGYSSPGGHSYSYDIHTGNVDWEIWIGVLPAYQGSRTATINAINLYLDKNHTYRTTGYSFSHTYLQINEHHSSASIAEDTVILSYLSSGSYSWQPLTLDPTAVFYFRSFQPAYNVDAGYAGLSSNGAAMCCLDAHGSPLASGQMDRTWIQTHTVNAGIFVNGACASGDLDETGNILSLLLYSPTSQVVIAHGTTDDSGGMGTNSDGYFGHNIAEALDSGESYGEALLGHVNVPLIMPWADDRELHYGVQVVLGDPSLGL